MELIQVTTTLPDEKSARELAAALVDQNLAACVQVSGPVHSTYRWQEQIENSTEFYCVAKSKADDFERVVAAIRVMHPYEVPEIIATPISHVSDDYRQWMLDQLS